MTHVVTNGQSWGSRTFWRRRGLVLGGAIAAVATAMLLNFGVDDSVSAADRQVIPTYLAGIPAIGGESTRSYEQEIAFIGSVQRAVFRVAPLNEGIAYDSEREPRDLLAAGHGLCYDRSRVIEKILRYAGFDARHVAIYSTSRTGSALVSLLTPHTPSHAVSEVLTKAGWLVIDSDDPWMSLDADGQPVAMATIAAAVNGASDIRWREPLPNLIYQQPFTFVYGLYSRNGHLYPPYGGGFPDVNYAEFVDNIW